MCLFQIEHIKEPVSFPQWTSDIYNQRLQMESSLIRNTNITAIIDKKTYNCSSQQVSSARNFELASKLSSKLE